MVVLAIISGLLLSEYKFLDVLKTMVMFSKLFELE